jgi:hypothetical protein
MFTQLSNPTRTHVHEQETRAAPFFDNGLPRKSLGNLFQHIGHKNARAAKGRLAMTNLWISNDVTS